VRRLRRQVGAFVACTLLATPGGPPAFADDLVKQLGLRAAATPVREDARWSTEGPIVVRILAPEQLTALQAAAGDTPLIGAMTEAEALQAANNATAILGFCSAALLDAAPKLHWLQLYSAGAENCVGLPQIRNGDVLLTNLQRVSSPTIAEHVLAMMLSLARGMPPHIAAQATGDWNPGLVPSTSRVELSGRTLLVVGLGGIGTAVAQRADALGMRVIAVRASGRPGPDFVIEVAKPDRLLEMAARADVVVNSVPLTPATEGVFDEAFFAAMRSSAFFINVGRGGSVVTQDLVDALQDGAIAGAGLDVTEPEPLPADHPLWRLPNVIITPHVSAQSDRIFDRVFAVVAENLRRYVEGDPMLSVVDPTAGY
jgi:phosphoglycerate dehydrogenase-like enzyme